MILLFVYKYQPTELSTVSGPLLYLQTLSGQSVYLAANHNMLIIYALGGLYSMLPAPLMASRPSSAVISTVVWIFDNAPPAAAAISADAAVTLSGPVSYTHLTLPTSDLV